MDADTVVLLALIHSVRSIAHHCLDAWLRSRELALPDRRYRGRRRDSAQKPTGSSRQLAPPALG